MRSIVRGFDWSIGRLIELTKDQCVHYTGKKGATAMKEGTPQYNDWLDTCAFLPFPPLGVPEASTPSPVIWLARNPYPYPYVPETPVK